MGDMMRLPGDGCRYFVRGRCFYEERLNPGYEAKWRCDVLVHWEEVYDDFLARAEAFGLDPADVPELWRERFERLMREETHCDRYVYARGVDLPSCGNGVEHFCLLEMPRCEGRCRKFALVAEK